MMKRLPMAPGVCAILLFAILSAITANGQADNRSGSGKGSLPARQPAFPWPLMTHSSPVKPAGALNVPVLGSGTLGRLTKWTGFTSSNSVIGDTTIFEDKFGNVGIGTDAPTSRFTVVGTIETTLGGFRFPDGTLQTTAATTGLQSVFHNSTLQGNGTSSAPLGVALPLILTGAKASDFLFRFANVGAGSGMRLAAGDTGAAIGGVGLQVFGGRSALGFGGEGVTAVGGSGGTFGGDGAKSFGGSSDTGIGGNGISGAGGDSNSNNGGSGATVTGGKGGGAGHFGGVGIVAIGGAGVDGATAGPAAQFGGDVSVSGNLSKGGGSFKIDHPLDPENKYLYHSFVESPDMKNIYDGVAKMDANGEAIVQLPEWFEALNKEFRYLLTAIGAPSPSLYIAEEISDNRFKIAGGVPGMKVSWQVTGIRQDAYANKHRIPVEETKPEPERGSYLHPDSFNQSEAKNVLLVQHPELIERTKERRTKHVCVSCQIRTSTSTQ